VEHGEQSAQSEADRGRLTRKEDDLECEIQREYSVEL
jgi:hypothetical protein